jgi:hypothetical protein
MQDAPTLTDRPYTRGRIYRLPDDRERDATGVVGGRVS